MHQHYIVCDTNDIKHKYYKKKKKKKEDIWRVRVKVPVAGSEQSEQGQRIAIEGIIFCWDPFYL